MDENEEQRVAEWYNTLSPSYDELYSEEQFLKHKTVIEFTRNEKFKILVDVGCGSGTFLQSARQLYEYAVGIDLSIDMLRAAKKKIVGNVDLILATSRTLPIKDQTADGLVSISTLKADSGLPPLLNEMRRIGRKNGLLAVTLLQEPGSEIPSPIADSEQSMILSDHEKLYFLRLNK